MELKLIFFEQSDAINKLARDFDQWRLFLPLIVTDATKNAMKVNINNESLQNLSRMALEDAKEDIDNARHLG